MSKPKNAVWRFFASVKLALVTLIVLAAVSIIGTLIKQGQPPTFYVEEYGQGLARVFEQLNLTEMYSAWWFIALLCLFAVNLLVCSIERLPGVWRRITNDGLDIDPGQLEKMESTLRVDTRLAVNAAAERVRAILAGAGWKKLGQADRNGSILFAGQKGAWTRLGVYIVHLSIMIILIGAIIGSLFGYQAYVFIPEGTSSSNIYLRKDKQPVPLGYDLRSEWFEKTFYPNGMIKQYRTELTVLDQDLAEPYRKIVFVNEPLTYQGHTFYVGDAFPMDEYFVVIRNLETGAEQAFRVPPERDVAWQGTPVSFRILELDRNEEGIARRAKVRFGPEPLADNEGFWINDKATVTIRQQDGEYSFTYRQLYSTLLLVTKDPGVLTVYFGFCLMVVGLAVSFFMSHRRIWVHIAPHGKSGAQILVGGGSNKNKPGFARRFEDLVNLLQQEQDGTFKPPDRKKRS